MCADEMILAFMMFCTIQKGIADSMFEDTEVGETFRRLLVDYERSFRPNYLDSSVKVKLDMLITGFGEINEKTMTVDIEMFLRQEWYDYRLKHAFKKKLTPLFGKKIPADYIWVPDTYFVNAIKTSRQRVTTSNERLDIYPDGRVFLGSSLNVKASCKMDFRNYPMDVQHCSLGLGSYSYDIRHLFYEWYDKPLSSWSVELQQFTLYDVKNESKIEHYIAGGKNYSELWAKFTLKRRMAVHIMTVFFPSCSLVCISWVSFWFHRHCPSARVGLGIITLLTSCKIWFSVNLELPRVSYLKAIDVYFIGSFCFIGCVLLEYAVVMNFEFYRRKQKKTKYMRDKRDSWKERNSVTSTTRLGQSTTSFMLPSSWLFKTSIRCSVEEKPKEKSVVKGLDNQGRFIEYADPLKEVMHPLDLLPKKVNRDEMPYFYKAYPIQGKATSIDNVSRFLFPFLYTCFNVIFWVTYHSSHHAHNIEDH